MAQDADTEVEVDIEDEAAGEEQVAAENAPEKPYEPTSCACRAQEGDLHSTWCDLKVFPAGLPMPRAEVEELNARYAQAHGHYVEGELHNVCYSGDYRVFPCACGCGARTAVTGMLWALRPAARWWIHSHAIPGVVHRGRRYLEQAHG